MKSFLEEKYKLKKNPFESRVDLEAPLANRKREQQAWQKVLNQRVGGKASSFNFVVGDYGSGKSFTLYQIYKDCLKFDNALPVYMKFLTSDVTRKFGLEFVKKVFKSIDDTYGLIKVLKSNTSRDIQRMASVYEEAARVFSRVRAGDKGGVNFLTLETPANRADMNALGITRNMNSTDIAIEYLTAFLFLLKQSEKLSLMLSVDEVEYVFSQLRGAKVAMVFNALRELYDLVQSPKALELGGVSNVIVFFGISDDGFRRLNDLRKREASQGGPINPFMRRTEAEIVLGNLSKEATTELIELRLKYNRTTKTYEKEPLIPFTKEFVDYIFDLTDGDPGDVVERCDYVVVDGQDEKIPLLTVDFAKKVFQSRNLTFETEVAAK